MAKLCVGANSFLIDISWDRAAIARDLKSFKYWNTCKMAHMSSCEYVMTTDKPSSSDEQCGADP